ncbi:MAG: glycosyl hydrolase [Acutalibacteraceae bacterium]
MDQKLFEIKNNKEQNYLLPFYWQQGNHTDKIPMQIQEIYDSGARAVCLESRTHEGFCQDTWWRDLDVIIKEAQKRDMKVWILDDKHFPSGYANGVIEKNRDLQKYFLLERYIDVVGPQKNCSILATKFEKDDIFVGAFMYKRDEDGKEIADSYIDLSQNKKGEYIYFDVPDGFYRIYLLFRSHCGADEHIDMLNEKSVDAFINAVYEPHYEHLKEYFGNVISGFFSDEPGFYHDYFKWALPSGGFYNKSVGCNGLTLPYSDTVLEMMNEELGFDAKPYLPLLWHNFSDKTAKIRLSYMNAVTRIYQKNFCNKIGDWCRNHGVEYIGHIIEDNNAHARLGSSAGHYFRSQSGQDMAGIDIVYQQVLPGFAHYNNGFCGACQETDSVFFHYSLAKMCSSAAHIDPKKKNRAMCETFGAGGWAEGSKTFKWLIDFLLVRGVNHFVPHAFSPSFPNEDCPPHFGAQGHDPQFDAFTALMKYTNKASHLLQGTHIANAAVLYHAEGEWASRDDYMYMQVPARQLYDNHIDFDFLPIDTVMESSVKDKKLVVNKEKYDCLFIPFTHYFDDKFLDKLNSLEKSGFKVVFMKALPDNCTYNFDVTDNCYEYFSKKFVSDITVNGSYPLLRHYHLKRENTDVFMFFNESATKTVDTTVNIGIRGKFTRLDMLNDLETVEESNGSITLKLEPYQSNILVFDNYGELSKPQQLIKSEKINPEFKISIADYNNLSDFKEYTTTRELINITSSENMPDFSGKIKYETDINIKKTNKTVIDFGEVNENIRLFINGKDCGIRICPPYSFDITKYIENGKNQITAIVSNTLVYKFKDRFSYFQQLSASGIQGDIIVKYYN